MHTPREIVLVCSFPSYLFQHCTTPTSCPKNVRRYGCSSNQEEYLSKGRLLVLPSIVSQGIPGIQAISTSNERIWTHHAVTTFYPGVCHTADWGHSAALWGAAHTQHTQIHKPCPPDPQHTCHTDHTLQTEHTVQHSEATPPPHTHSDEGTLWHTVQK